MSAVDDFMKACGDGLAALAKSTLQQAAAQGQQAALDFAKSSLDDLQRWTKLAATGQLSKDEMAALLRTRADRFSVEALEAQGLAQVKVDAFKQQAIGLIVDSAFNLLKTV